MSTTKPAPLSDADYLRCARMVDARTWPVVDRFLATIGMTRAQLMARKQPPTPVAVAGRGAGEAGEEEGRAA